MNLEGIFRTYKIWVTTSRHGRLFNAVVFFPVLFTLIYLWLLAPDRYEAKAVVMVIDSVSPSIDGGIINAITSGGQGKSG